MVEDASATGHTTASISGVVVTACPRQVNARGWLQEIDRSAMSGADSVAQVYATATLPGVVKAWYRHQRQTDHLAIIEGAVELVLWDARPESASSGRLQRIELRDTDPVRVRIPPGVWHGFRATPDRPAILLHLNSRAWDPADPDEERLPGDSPLIPFRWS